MASKVRTDLKIIVVGQPGAGKTSFVRRWTSKSYQETYQPTVVSEFGFKIYQYKEDLYRIQLWDIGGQDKSSAMAKVFSRDSHGCIVISDCNELSSLEGTLNWQNLVKQEANFIDGGNLPFILIQNKIDLIEDKDELLKIEEKTKKISEDNKFDKYYMTSVKNNINVEEAMNYLIENIIERIQNYSKSFKNGDSNVQRDSLALEKTSIRKKSTCC